MDYENNNKFIHQVIIIVRFFTLASTNAQQIKVSYIDNFLKH